MRGFFMNATSFANAWGYRLQNASPTFENHLDLVRRRDDLAVELCALYNLLDRPADALNILNARHFQPWEGGEGEAIGQYVHAHLALGRELGAGA